MCHSQVSNQTTTQRTAYEADITACNAQNECVPLCKDVFQIQAVDIASCEIRKSDLSTVTVRVIVNDPARCEAGATDAYLDWGDDDGYEDDNGCDNDDGSCDDGSADDGDDGSDDGSTDDGSTDDGSSDDGSTDDAVPHVPAAAPGVHYTLAPVN